jgi:hypothetical protein
MAEAVEEEVVVVVAATADPRERTVIKIEPGGGLVLRPVSLSVLLRSRKKSGERTAMELFWISDIPISFRVFAPLASRLRQITLGLGYFPREAACRFVSSRQQPPVSAGIFPVKGRLSSHWAI